MCKLYYAHQGPFWSINDLYLYLYIGGSRNCLKEVGGAAYHDYYCPPFGPERRDYSTKNNPFLVKFSDRGGGVATVVYMAWLDNWHVRRTKIKVDFRLGYL